MVSPHSFEDVDTISDLSYISFLSHVGRFGYVLLPTHRVIIDVGSVQIVQLVYFTFRFVVIMTITLFWILFSFLSYFRRFHDCSLCMVVIRLMRLVWRFSISPFAGNFLALVSGRYT